MSDLARYRKLYPRLFRHPGFAHLSEGEKLLAIYLLTGPQTNRIGLYDLSIPAAAEELGNVPQTFAKRLANVCQTFGWLFDAHARVMYIPSWWRWNPPENPNVLKGNLRDLSDIRPCGLVDAFARNLGNVPETLHQTFLEGLQERIPKGLPNQKQDQDQDQKQKQEPALRAHGGTDGNPHGWNPQTLPARIEAIAKEVYRTAPHGDHEYLIDATLIYCRKEKIHVDRATVIKALAAVTVHG